MNKCSFRVYYISRNNRFQYYFQKNLSPLFVEYDQSQGRQTSIPVRTETGSGAESPYSLFMRRIFCAPPLRWSGPLSPLKPGWVSFNIQNPIPHKSQKARFFLETTRAKECQRGGAGAAERAKESCKWLPEGSDTRLGAGCRRFESCHSDHLSWKNRLFRRFFCISDNFF